MIRLNAVVALLAACVIALLPAAATAQTKLLRFPDIHGDRVAFCYAGDLWTAPAAGGTATRLTAHPGSSCSRSSRPTASGSRSPASTTATSRSTSSRPTGGVPKQLTFYPARGPLPPRWGYDNQVYGWTPRRRARAVPLAARRDGGALADTRSTRCRSDGGLPVPLPMPTSGGRRLLARRQAHRLLAAVPRLPHLEALRGRLGAGPLHLRPRDRNALDADRAPARAPSATRCGSATRSTSSPTATGTLNLYAYDLETRARSTQLTHEHDLGRALAVVATTRGEIVYELDGELHVFDVAARKDDASSRSRCPTTASPRGRRAYSADEEHRGLRALAQGRARAVRGARRRLHRARSRRARRAT